MHMMEPASVQTHWFTEHANLIRSYRVQSFCSSVSGTALGDIFRDAQHFLSYFVKCCSACS